MRLRFLNILTVFPGDNLIWSQCFLKKNGKRIYLFTPRFIINDSNGIFTSYQHDYLLMFIFFSSLKLINYHITIFDFWKSDLQILLLFHFILFFQVYWLFFPHFILDGPCLDYQDFQSTPSWVLTFCIIVEELCQISWMWRIECAFSFFPEINLLINIKASHAVWSFLSLIWSSLLVSFTFCALPFLIIELFLCV